MADSISGASTCHQLKPLILLVSSAAIFVVLSSNLYFPDAFSFRTLTYLFDISHHSSSQVVLIVAANPTSLSNPRRFLGEEEKNARRLRRKRGVEEGLDRARAAIRRATTIVASSLGNSSALFNGEDMPTANVYRNPAAFFRSYHEMEKRFKVYVYEEGEPPLVHMGPCKNIYTIEGRFIEEMEMMRGMRTWDPYKAHAFFLPFSVAQMVSFVYEPPSTDMKPFIRLAADYVRVIASKHPFWNRTAGIDHFMLACHDWGPYATKGKLYRNSIRALCNANTSEDFRPNKDVSIPEINLINGDIPMQLLSPRSSNLSRPFLAFFAGGLHGPIRLLLLKYWKNRDLEYFPIYEYLPTGLDYYSFLLNSRFCLCPSGYDVTSPRIVEAIYAECIPVIISEGYVLPFSDVLRWKEFSVSVEVADIPKLKEVLEGISEEKVKRLTKGIRAVRRHFVLNQSPKRFDVFNMILHSVWLRRLNVRSV